MRRSARTTARSLVLSLAVCLAAAAGASAQTAQEWITRGHHAARESRHTDAIAAYERAIAAAPALRAELLASLGRQYLWADQPARAAELLAEYLETHDDCDIRNDYGLALSWAGELRDARRVFDRVIAACPGIAGTARLRQATVYRWLERPTRAAALYRQLLGDTAAAVSARLGLATVALQQGYPRRALRYFRIATPTLSAADARAAREGMAIALARLGEYEDARAIVADVSGSAPSRDMRALAEHIAALDRPHVAPTVLSLHDADGTRFTAWEVRSSRGWGMRGRGGVAAGQWLLDGADEQLRAVSIGAFAEHRWSPDVALRGEVRAQHVGRMDWTPVTAELHTILTPHDLLRADVSVARLTVTDNNAAVRARLTGRFMSVGADVRVTNTVTAIAGIDVTSWSTGNQRSRARGNVRWRPEGQPRLTLEWPVLIQRYDEPMPFPFFAPRRYLETGPAAQLDARAGGAWTASAYARGGFQRESGLPWDPFGTLRASVARELSGGWSARGAVGWSDSNLASTTSFRRTTLELAVIRSF